MDKTYPEVVPKLAPTDSPPAVSAIIGLHWLHWALEQSMEKWEALFDPDLNRAERRMIVALDAPRRMGQLAEELGLLPSSLTALADSVAAKGMITRHRDPADRRAWLIDLTDEGRALRQQMMQFAADQFACLTGLNDGEIQELARLTSKARATIHTHEPFKGPTL